MDIEEVARQIVDASIQVHRVLGPGLLESVYQVCLAHELRKRGLKVECEVTLPVVYDGLRIDEGFRIDMVVEKAVLVENKAQDQI
jgi:GxxExxY protein